MNKLIRFSNTTAHNGLYSLGKIIYPDNRSFLKNLARLKLMSNIFDAVKFLLEFRGNFDKN